MLVSVNMVLNVVLVIFVLHVADRIHLLSIILVMRPPNSDTPTWYGIKNLCLILGFIIYGIDTNI